MDCIEDDVPLQSSIFREILIQNLPIFVYRCEEIHFLDDDFENNHYLIFRYM
jgi:hypothetical protein